MHVAPPEDGRPYVEIVDLTGVTQTMMSHWEKTNELSVFIIPFLKMSMSLDIPLDWLFFNDLVVGSISEEEKDTMRKATKAIQQEMNPRAEAEKAGGPFLCF